MSISTYSTCYVQNLALLFSDFGTGKTLLLIHKATKLLKKRERVVFAVCYVVNKPIYLLRHLRQHFDCVMEEHKLDKNLLEVTALEVSSLNSEINFPKVLRQKVAKSHVIVDEVIDHGGFVLDDLERNGEDSLANCLWIAHSSDCNRIANKGDSNLKRVFRNQPNIIRYLNFNKETEANTDMDSNNPPVITIFYHK